MHNQSFNQNLLPVDVSGLQSGLSQLFIQAELHALISFYLSQLRLSELAVSTIARYASCLHSYSHFLGPGGQPSEYTAKLFLSHLKAQGLAQRSISIYYHALRPFLASINVPLKIKFKKHRRLPVYTSIDQVSAIIRTIQTRDDQHKRLVPRDLAIVYTLAYTGVRRAELLSLTTKHVDFEHRTLRVIGKGDQERIIPISGHLYDVLYPYCKSLPNGARLFPLSPRRLNTLITFWSRRAGVEHLHPHSFRHFCATQLIEAGIPLHVIQQILGHSDISTTVRSYAGVDSKDLKAAADKLHF